jgi:hypothetical protein
MRIDASGNVGIGTTIPAHLLDVNGNARIRGVGNQLYFDTDGSSAAIQLRTVNSFEFSINNDRGVASEIRVSNSGLRFFTAASERIRVDGDGNVGIGTTAPTTFSLAGRHLEVDGSNGNYSFIHNRTTNVRSFYAINDVDDLAALFTYTNHPLTFGTNNTERARITSGGYFKASNAGTYFNATTSVHELRNNVTANEIVHATHTTSSSPYGMRISYTAASPNGTDNWFLYCDDSTALRAEIRSNGGLANYSANNVNLASDERLKKDISPLASTWNKLKAMEVVNFRYKDCNEGDPALYGVIAQQVQPIVPELVVVTREAKEAQDAIEAQDAVLDEDGNVLTPSVEAKPAVEAVPEYYGIREQPMYWLAIKALQEAMARIEALETSNTELMARIDTLES